jgi:hypothetical protein
MPANSTAMYLQEHAHQPTNTQAAASVCCERYGSTSFAAAVMQATPLRALSSSSSSSNYQIKP